MIALSDDHNSFSAITCIISCMYRVLPEFLLLILDNVLKSHCNNVS